MVEADSADEESEISGSSPSPGEILAQAREEKGLSRIRVSELLGLTQSVIRDIELCRFDKFPSGIYVRGYIRNYSKLVEADLEEVLAAYDLYGETHETPEEAPFGGSIQNTPKNTYRNKLIAAVIIVAAAVAFWVFT